MVTRLLDWDDDAALAAAVAEHGPFFAVVGAALKFEDWPVGRLDAVLGVLDPTVVVLAHAWADDDVESCWQTRGGVPRRSPAPPWLEVLDDVGAAGAARKLVSKWVYFFAVVARAAAARQGRARRPQHNRRARRSTRSRTSRPSRVRRRSFAGAPPRTRRGPPASDPDNRAGGPLVHRGGASSAAHVDAVRRVQYFK